MQQLRAGVVEVPQQRAGNVHAVLFVQQQQVQLDLSDVAVVGLPGLELQGQHVHIWEGGGTTWACGLEVPARAHVGKGAQGTSSTKVGWTKGGTPGHVLVAALPLSAFVLVG